MLFAESFCTSWKTTYKTVSYVAVWSPFNWSFDTSLIRAKHSQYWKYWDKY